MQINNSKSIKETIEVLSNTNNLEKEEVITILENHVFPKAIRQNYSKETNIETKIDRDNFNVKAYMIFDIVEDEKEEFNPIFEIKKSESNGLNIGDKKINEIKEFDIQKRNCIIVAKQVLSAEINKLKKSKIRKEALQFKDQLMNVVVKKFDLKRKVYFVEFNGEFSGIIPFNNLFGKNEKLKVNERYLAFLTKEEDQRFQEQVIFTRTGSEFLNAIFRKEIPEIYDEIVEVKDLYINENKKIFISVYSNDKNIDPVGTFVGVKGNRISNILKHINGVNIDVSKWSHDTGEYIISIFKDLEIERISILDNSIFIFVEDEVFQSLNEQSKLRLKAANKFLNEKVFITTDSIYEKSNQHYTKYFKEELMLDEESARFIANTGVFKSIDDFVEIEPETIEEILDLDSETVEELISNAQQSINSRNTKLALIETNLKDLEKLKKHHLKMLLDIGINNISDLSDLSNDELCEEITIDFEDANEVIMETREILYGDL